MRSCARRDIVIAIMFVCLKHSLSRIVSKSDKHVVDIISLPDSTILLVSSELNILVNFRRGQP